MRGKEVGDADGTCPAGLEQLLQRTPRLDVPVEPRQRPVNEIQVDVVQAEAAKAGVEGLLRRREALVGAAELGGDEDVFARHTRVDDPSSHADLVLVLRGRVDQGVPDVQGLGDGPPDLLVTDAGCAQAELRHLDAIVESEYRNHRASVEERQGLTINAEPARDRARPREASVVLSRRARTAASHSRSTPPISATRCSVDPVSCCTRFTAPRTLGIARTASIRRRPVRTGTSTSMVFSTLVARFLPGECGARAVAYPATDHRQRSWPRARARCTANDDVGAACCAGCYVSGCQVAPSSPSPATSGAGRKIEAVDRE